MSLTHIPSTIIRLDLIKIFREDFQTTFECVLKCCHKITQEMYMYVIVSRSLDIFCLNECYRGILLLDVILFDKLSSRKGG